jgi:hypothetical protein
MGDTTHLSLFDIMLNMLLIISWVYGAFPSVVHPSDRTAFGIVQHRAINSFALNLEDTVKPSQGPTSNSSEAYKMFKCR